MGQQHQGGTCGWKNTSPWTCPDQCKSRILAFLHPNPNHGHKPTQPSTDHPANTMIWPTTVQLLGTQSASTPNPNLEMQQCKNRSNPCAGHRISQDTLHREEIGVLMKRPRTQIRLNLGTEGEATETWPCETHKLRCLRKAEQHKAWDVVKVHAPLFALATAFGLKAPATNSATIIHAIVASTVPTHTSYPFYAGACFFKDT